MSTGDITGPVSTKSNGDIPISFLLILDIRMSFGLELGVLEYSIDLTSIQFYLPDPTLPNAVLNKIEPDASAGVYVYRYDFNVGLSANHLFNLHEQLTLKAVGFTELQTHFYLMGGYKYRSTGNGPWSRG